MGNFDIISQCFDDVFDINKITKQARRDKKEQWIAKARKEFKPSERDNCFVCGKYKNLTHAHHLIPLSVQYNFRVSVPLQEHEWLCPTHHTMIHLLFDDRFKRTKWEFKDLKLKYLSDVPEIETEMIVRIYNKTTQAIKGIKWIIN